MSWVTYGKSSHNTPLILRFGRFGPSEGGVWICQCGTSHTIVKLEDGTLAWDWRVAEEKAEKAPEPQIFSYRTLANDLLVALHGEGHAESTLARPIEQVVRMLRQLDQWGYLSVTLARQAPGVPKQG